MARKGTRDESTGPRRVPTDDDWRYAIDHFLAMYALDSAHSRLQARKLVRGLEREALEVFRVARRLEWTGVKEPPTQLKASAILARLGEEFQKRHIDLARLDLDDLDMPELNRRQGDASRRWYRQGGKLLAGVEHLNYSLSLYERHHEAIRGTSGRSRSIAWDHLMGVAESLRATDDEVAQQLVRVRFVQPHEIDVLRLKESIKKHRLRRQERKRDKTKVRKAISSRSQ